LKAAKPWHRMVGCARKFAVKMEGEKVLVELG
jgi:hypothetical protein